MQDLQGSVAREQVETSISPGWLNGMAAGDKHGAIAGKMPTKRLLIGYGVSGR
jgi:hypothetical protein